jgi:hypothetical protein
MDERDVIILVAEWVVLEAQLQVLTVELDHEARNDGRGLLLHGKSARSVAK